MADIAAVFHWPPDVLDAMTPDDLAQWHALAAARVKLAKGWPGG